MSLLGLFNLLLLLFGGTTGDAHSSSNYYHLFRGIVLGRVPASLSRCPRVSQRTHLGAPVPSRETSSITESLPDGGHRLQVSRVSFHRGRGIDRDALPVR